jgi:hypothetical protein
MVTTRVTCFVRLSLGFPRFVILYHVNAGTLSMSANASIRAMSITSTFGEPYLKQMCDEQAKIRLHWAPTSDNRSGRDGLLRRCTHNDSSAGSRSKKRSPLTDIQQDYCHGTSRKVFCMYFHYLGRQITWAYFPVCLFSQIQLG